MTNEDVDRVARRVVELVGDELRAVIRERLEDSCATVGLVDATQLASRLGLSPKWVRDHAEQLGVVRLGAGPKPRLRFDLAVATQRLTAMRTARPTPQAARPRPEFGGPQVRPRHRRQGSSSKAV